MKKYRFDKRKFARFVCCVVVVSVLLGMASVAIDFIRFPECYLPAWRYQLKNDIKRGDAEMIEYYNRVYVANGRELFE